MRRVRCGFKNLTGLYQNYFISVNLSDLCYQRSIYFRHNPEIKMLYRKLFPFVIFFLAGQFADSSFDNFILIFRSYLQRTF